MKKFFWLLIIFCVLVIGCGQSERNGQQVGSGQITKSVETATKIPPTLEATSTMAPTFTPTAANSQTPTATFAPRATDTATPTETPSPSATPLPTFTPTATPTSTAIATVSPPIESDETATVPPPVNTVEEETRTAVFNAIVSQLQWLDILINTLEPNSTVDPYSPWLELESYDGNVKCGAFLHALEQVKTAPVIDVQNSELDVQNAYNVYRAGLDKIVTDHDIEQWAMACQTAIQEGQENLVPSNFQRGILRQPMDEARHLLNQARSIVEEQQ